MDNELMIPDILGNKNLTNHIKIVNKKELPKYLNKSDINSMLENITNYKDKFFCIFLWMTGLRVSEIIGIKKSDINIKEGVVIVRWLKSRKYLERIVPLHQVLCQTLEVYIGGMNQDEKIFPFSRVRAFYITKKWLGVSPHKLRHSFAVNWLRENGDIAQLKQMLGHKYINTTGEYLKIVPSDIAKELNKIKF